VVCGSYVPHVGKLMKESWEAETCIENRVTVDPQRDLLRNRVI
jgi:hypothetical protein